MITVQMISVYQNWVGLFDCRIEGQISSSTQLHVCLRFAQVQNCDLHITELHFKACLCINCKHLLAMHSVSTQYRTEQAKGDKGSKTSIKTSISKRMFVPFACSASRVEYDYALTA